MYELVMPAGALILLAFAVVRWRAHDLAEHGRLTRGAAGFTAICIWLHGWLVALAAYDGLARIGTLRPGFVAVGAVVAAAGMVLAAVQVREIGWTRVVGYGEPTAPDGQRRALAAVGWSVGLIGITFAGQSAGAALLAGPVIWVLAAFADRARLVPTAVPTVTR